MSPPQDRRSGGAFADFTGGAPGRSPAGEAPDDERSQLGALDGRGEATPPAGTGGDGGGGGGGGDGMGTAVKGERGEGRKGAGVGGEWAQGEPETTAVVSALVDDPEVRKLA